MLDWAKVGANLGSRSVFQSTSMAPTSSEIYFLPCVPLPYGVDFSTHCRVPGVLWHIQRRQHPSLRVSRGSWKDYIGYMVMPQGFCVKSLTTVSTLSHRVTTLTPLNGRWRSASLNSTTLKSCQNGFKTELLYWSSRMGLFQVDLESHIQGSQGP